MSVDSVQERYGPVFVRLGLGVVMVVHGAGKALNVGPAASGVPGFAESLSTMGLPAPLVFAWLVTAIELGGGLAVLLGLFTRVAAALIAVEMAVAAILVHLPNGFLVSEGGFEFAFVLSLAALSLVATGAGTLSVANLAFERTHRVAQLS